MRNPFSGSTFSDTFFPRPKTFRMGNTGGGQNSAMGASGGRTQSARPLWGSDWLDQSAQPPVKRPEVSEWGGYLDELRDIYTKEGEATQSYRRHLEEVPVYQSPGGWGKFGAALVGAAEGLRSGGAAGFEAGQSAAQAPYRRAMEEWGIKEQALARNANIEDQRTARRLSFMKEARELSQDEKEYRRWMDEFDLKNRQQDALEEHREAERQHWKSQGYRTRIDEDGNEIAYHPGIPNSERVLGGSSKKRDWMYEEGRLDESRRGNDIAAGQLDLGRRRENRMDRREERYENEPISASEQSAARASALSRAAAERRGWSEFVSPEGGINHQEADKPEKRARFREFMRRVEEIEDGIFSRRRYTGRDEIDYEY